MFASNRPGGLGANDLYVSHRRNPRVDFGWDSPESLGSGVNSSFQEATPDTFEDDTTGNLTLYFTSNRPGGPGDFDIYTSVLGDDGTFGPAVLVPGLSSRATDWYAVPRRDGLELFLISNRNGTLGGNDLWVSTRASTSDPWSPPVNLGSSINSTATDDGPAISFGRTSLIFFSDRPGGFGGNDLYTTTRAKVPGPTTECTVTGTPAISAVLNGGSFQAGISANAMVSIFGSGFAPQGTSRAVGRLAFSETRYPTELSCVALEVAGLRAPVTYVSSNQINAQLPSLTITGPVEMRVILNPGRPNEIRGASQSVPIQARAPAFFTFVGSTIAAQHTNFVPLADRPGPAIPLFCTERGSGLPCQPFKPATSRTARPYFWIPFRSPLGEWPCARKIFSTPAFLLAPSAASISSMCGFRKRSERAMFRLSLKSAEPGRRQD